MLVVVMLVDVTEVVVDEMLVVVTLVVVLVIVVVVVSVDVCTAVKATPQNKRRMERKKRKINNLHDRSKALNHASRCTQSKEAHQSK